MARVRMVTRSVSITNCEVMCLTISTAAVSTDTLKISGTFDSKEEALKVVKKQYETADYKPTAIINMQESEILYGMPEEKFIELAQILPPRKVYTKEAEEETEN